MPAPNLISVKKLARKNDTSEGQLNSTQGIVLKGGSEHWRVQYDGIVDQFAVQNAAGLPKVGDTAVSISGTNSTTLVVQRVQPIRLAENPYCWDCQIDIRDTAVPHGPFNVQINKTDAIYEEQAFADRLKKPLVNAAGDLLPQLTTVSKADKQINISYSISGGTVSASADVPNISTIDDCVQKVNMDSCNFTICGRYYSFTPRQLKLQAAPIRSSRTVIANVVSGTTTAQVYQFSHDVELQLLYRTDKFHWRAPNEGFRGIASVSNRAQYTPAPGTNIVTFQDYGQPRSQPTKLDATGMELSPALTGSNAVTWCPDVLPDATSPPGRFEIEDQTPFGNLFFGSWGNLSDP